MSSTARIRRWWTDEEDQTLRTEAEIQLKTSTQVKDWNRVAAKLPGRTNKDCRKRWSKVKEDVKKGAWSIAEDKKLQKAIERHGFRWTDVAREVGSRHADQCAKRWQHYLDPRIDHSEWQDPADDERLIVAVNTFGRDWKSISEKVFPGRSPTDLKNRHSIVERRRRQSLPASTRENVKTAVAPTRMEVEQDSESSVASDDIEEPFAPDEDFSEDPAMTFIHSPGYHGRLNSLASISSYLPTHSSGTCGQPVLAHHPNSFDNLDLSAYGDMPDMPDLDFDANGHCYPPSTGDASTIFLGDPGSLMSGGPWLPHLGLTVNSDPVLSPGALDPPSLSSSPNKLHPYGKQKPPPSPQLGRQLSSSSITSDVIPSWMPNMTLTVGGEQPSHHSHSASSSSGMGFLPPALLREGSSSSISSSTTAALRATMRATLTFDEVASDTLQDVLQVLMERKTKVQIHFPH